MCRALDATGLREYRIALGDASLYPALLRGFELGEEATERLMAELVSRDFVGLEREARALGLSARRRRPADATCRSCAAVRACSTRLPGPAADAAAGLRASARAARRQRRRPDDLRPRLVARPRLLHRRRLRRARPRRWARRSAAAGATTTCSAASVARCPLSASRSASTGCTRRWRGRHVTSRGRRRSRRRSATRRLRFATSGMSTPMLTIAVPRGALFAEHARRSRRDRRRHGAGSRQRPQAALRRRRDRDDAARLTSPTYVEAGAADIGITGKDVLRRAVRARRLRAARPWLRAAAHGRRRRSPATPTPTAEALRRLGVMRVATKYPEIANRVLRANGSPGGDRRGQGLGRAGAADGHGRGDRRPHRDRHDAARERARHPRGARSRRPRG